ncbi:hypothetical protein C0995_016667 [Termitomyces sp. Mi166|nr:hypothetical protein C0995_016667 [Termitomyces sp. Mi166\
MSQSDGDPSLQHAEQWAEYSWQCDVILKELCLLQNVFSLRTQEFLKDLGHSASEATMEVWVDCILMFFKLYEQKDLSLCQLELLQGDALLHDELHDLVTEIHVFPLPAWHAPDTTAPKAAATNSNNQHQNNLEAASTLLQGLNLSEGLFEQATACKVGLLA